MRESILVTGGTGVLGRPLVDRLRADGHEVGVLSRHSEPPVDLRDGAGLDEALAGRDVVVHCATTMGGGDVRAAGRLLEAAHRAGVRHLVYISIVGVDRVPLPYYRTKFEVEGLVEGSGLEWTTLRATQFHQLVRRLLRGLARLPVLPVPDMPIQPVDAVEVAHRLAELAVAGPAGRVPDFGGPKVHPLRELAATYLRAERRRRPVLPLRLPGKTFRAYQRGEHTVPGLRGGRVTFEEFLDRGE
ncbi:SDR family oxidoreductase [Amycolatopsis nigrescens]|uniref:SDR family oxidoreductase n=1 Tax=Amycolatopsis nigrescens TaxID=381445 RepID=UPI00037AE304|nr:SDR family oxidoreductase [Amycolatopsis nigrescens]